MSNVTISETTAYTILRLMDDIADIDSRARCSDQFFRSHFINRAKAVNISGACEELKKAYDNRNAAKKPRTVKADKE